MNIQKKVITVFIISLVASVFAGVFIFVAVRQTRENISKLTLTNDIRTEIFRRANLLDEYLLFRGERSREQWVLDSQIIGRLLEAAKKKFTEPDEQAILVLLEKNNSIIKQTGAQIFENYSAQPNLTATARDLEVRLVSRLLIARSDMVDQANQLEVKARENITALQQRLGLSVGLLVAVLFIIILLNLTWIRTILKKLEEAGAKNRAMLSSLGEGVIGVDLSGKIILINQAANLMLGWRQEEIAGTVLAETVPIEDEKGNLIAPEKRPMSAAFTKGLTTSTSVVDSIYYYVRKDKTKFPVAISVQPILLNGKVIGAVEAFRDITKEKDIDRAKSEFVSLVSHQLRTPLSAVNWYTEMLLAGDAGDVNSRQKTYLEEIHTGSQLMVDMVNTFLSVSRLELGTFAIEPEPTDIVALTQSVIVEQKPQIKNKKIKISVASKKIPLINADPKLLRMVVQNLLSNAIKYTPKYGKVDFSLSLDKEKKNVIMKISDTGYGIPQDQQDRIFSKLFRASNVKKKDTSGTGLGLYIVKSIVDRSGGKIWFESEEGKGTTFYVTLPR